ncbi:MAG: response regulator, partial [Eudoraea sp.]|nr:response regulator [Eudoraea sp.]
MNSKKLLSKLSDIETYLDDFSFEELTATEASRLKKSFETFKTQLEGRLWGDPSSTENKTSVVHDQEAREYPDRAEEMLIATVSHEIRTPLSGIIGFTDLLRESELTEEQRYQVNAIMSASKALMDIINQLLEYSKLSAGLELFEEVDFNFFSIVQDVVYLCKTLMLSKEVKLKVELDPDIPAELLGDPSKLSQVLLNLLGNSVKFVEKGSIHLNVQCVQKRQEEVVLRFTVADTGIGIPEQDLEHIFTSFRQAKQHTFSKYGGTGLGLNIVKQIIQKLNGDIRVRSRMGEGTTFTFTLPYRLGKPHAIVADTGLTLSPDKIRGMHVLVFEDNEMNQKLIEQRLKSWGCTPYITENAPYGLKLLETKNIDLVLMDLKMPLLNGFEVTQRIRKHSSNSINSIPIIALTADFTAEDKVACDQYKINDYLLKPFSPEELLHKIMVNKQKEVGQVDAPINTGCRMDSTVSEWGAVFHEVLKTDCMGDLGVLEELVSLYHKNALSFIGKVKLHLKNQDYEGVAFEAHKIKCGLKMLKTYQLCSLVEELNELAKEEKNPGRMNDLYDQFVMEYAAVEKDMHRT